MDTNITYTQEQAVALLDSIAIEVEPWQSILHGNQKFWTVPSDFDIKDYNFPREAMFSFDFWGTEDDGSVVIRLWSKW